MVHLRMALALLALGLLGCGCGNATDKAADTATGQATETAAEEGEPSAEATAGYPDGFPDYLMIDGVAPEFANKDSIGGAATFSVAVVEENATVEELVGALRSQLEDAGCTSSIDDTSPGSAVVEYACDAGTASIIAGDAGGSASLTISFIEG
ncbi:MAG: hypothetical protein R2754_13115 [Microthrixaceae bacterium]